MGHQDFSIKTRRGTVGQFLPGGLQEIFDAQDQVVFPSDI